MVALDRERVPAVAQHLDLAGPARLDPEGRALRSGVAQQRPEDQLGGGRLVPCHHCQMTTVAGVAERVGAESDQPRGDDPEQVRPVRRVRELCERAVDADRLLRVEVDRRHDQEDADEPVHDGAGEVADDADPLDGAPHRRAHLLRLRILEEVPAQPLVALVAADPDQHEAADADEPRPARPAEHARRRLLRAAGARSAGAEEDLDGDRREARVDDAAAESREPVEPGVGALGAVSQRRAHEPPDRVAGQTDRDQDQEHLAERLPRDRPHRSLLARVRAGHPDREPNCQDADDPVHDAAGREARPCQALEGCAPDDLLPALPCRAGRTSGGVARCLDAHGTSYDGGRTGRPREGNAGVGPPGTA